MARLVTVELLVADDDETMVTDLLNEQLRAFMGGDEPFLIDYAYLQNAQAPENLQEVIDDGEYEEGMFQNDEFRPLAAGEEKSLEQALRILDVYGSLDIADAKDLPEPAMAIDILEDYVAVGLVPQLGKVSNLTKIARLSQDLLADRYEHITDMVRFEPQILTDDALNFAIAHAQGAKMHFDGERYLVSDRGEDVPLNNVAGDDAVAKEFAARNGIKTHNYSNTWGATRGGKQPMVLQNKLSRAVAEAFIYGLSKRDVEVPYVLMHERVTVTPPSPVKDKSPRM